MKKRIFSLFTALALCLSLLPGTALAEGDPGVIINSTSLESGKQYVAGEYGVIEKPADAPADTPYLDYRDGVLTVHGQMDLKSSPFTINGAVTFTGGGDSCLETANIYINGTLTLSGSMDFKPKSLNGNSSASPATKLTTTDDYSGDIAIQKTSTSVLLDVQSSASISIGGNVSYFSPDPPADPITLKSAGDISTDLLQYHTITIEGKNVSLMNSPVFTGKSLTVKAAENVTVPNCVVLFYSGNSTEAVSVDISAGGNVEITSSVVLMYDPPGGRNDSLTIHDAKSVSIQGITNDNNPSLFRAPVTFENCGNVTVTATGTGEILKEGVPVTSDCPWTAKTGDKTVTIPSGTWTYAGEAPTDDPYFLDNDLGPTCWKAGEGWMFYEPPASEGAPAKLILDGATYNERITIQKADSVQLELKGENAVKKLGAGALTLTGNGGFEGTLETGAFTNNSTATLNAVVIVSAEEGGVPTIGQTVYGNRSTADLSGGEGIVQEHTPITITNGATLTVPQDGSITILSLQGLTNHGTIVNGGAIVIDSTGSLGTPNFGTIVNNGEVTIYPPVDVTEEETSAFIKGLGLTGTGTVTVTKSGASTEYTNSGLKLLDPAGQGGTLDLSSVTSDDESKWEDQGYKWEDVETGDNGEITGGKLILAPGFNAETVVLPDAAVEIVSQGECVIETLTVTNPQKTELTLSGPGPLKIQEHVEITGGPDNRLTVAENAQVEVTGGVTAGAASSVDGKVTVNGTLTVAQGGGFAAIRTGMVEIGSSGMLTVSGETGLTLFGKNNDSGGRDYAGALTVRPGGSFAANCTDTVISVNSQGDGLGSLAADDIIVVPSGYLPQGCTPEFDDDRNELFIPGGDEEFTIDASNKPTPPPSGHRHAWAEDWTTSATHHWHNCAASGCPVTADSEKDGYAEHAYSGSWDETCNVCGYTRTLPDREPSDGSDDRDDRDGGDSAAVSYAVTVERTGHGNIRSSHARASAGSTVTLTAIPDSGYTLDTLSVTDSRGNAVKLTEKSGKHTFIMPGRAVTVRAVFAPLADSGACDGGAACPSRAFTDLKSGAWYHEAVDFVLRNGLMNGYGNGGSPAGSLFGPEDRLSRAQFAQILYNKEGRPAGAGSAPFTDVAPDAWCAPAIAWAAERGIAGGYGNGTFGPDDPITREQLAVMLWRYAESPAAPSGELSFMDAEQIGVHAREAICWAVESGVMSGKSGGVLDPKGLATRAQTAQMLKNFLENG